MQPIKCPHCGAPAQPPPGVPQYQCPYCKQVFATGFGLPPAPPPQHQTGGHPQVPHIVIIGPGGHFHDDDDDDDDDDHHYHHNPVAHVAAQGLGWVMRIVITLIILGVVVGGSSVAWFIRKSSFASSLVWDGKAPFDCSGNDDISVKGVTAEFSAGTAITANGNCHFTCTDCVIRAPTAIEAGGNAQVVIVNGTIEGKDILAEAGGNARVNISGNVTASGQVKQGGNARVSAPKAAATAAPSATATSTAPPPATTAPAAAKPNVATKPTATAKPTASGKK